MADVFPRADDFPMADDFKDAVLPLIAPLRGYAVALTGSAAEADDLVQEALLRAWRSRHTFTLGANLKAWLFQILRNAHFSEIKRRRFTAQDVEGRLAAQIGGDALQHWRLEFWDLLTAVHDLSPALRDALLLVCAGELTYEDAARILDCPVGAAKSRVNRARRKLSEIISHRAYDA